MKKVKPNHVILIIGIQCLVAACVPEPRSITNNACIPPLTDFAYYAGQGTPYPDEPVAPPDPWMIEATIDLKSPVLLGVRKLSKNVNELWFLEGWELDSQKQVYVFNTDEAELKTVVLNDTFSGFFYSVKDILIAPDNSVWTVHFYSNNPILGKYDEVTNEIIPVSILSEIEHNSSGQTIVLMHQQTGVFWFLVPYGYIYSYDPASDTLDKHISIEEKYPGGAVIMPDGNIYIYALSYEDTKHGAGDALFLYSPEEETIKQVSLYLERNIYPISLYLDLSERLWMGSYGWREPDGTWYQTVRSPLFVQAVGEPGGDRPLHWFPPDIEFETTDGLLWFAGAGGTYSLDFTTGEWCWVSTFSNLEKDADGNLWMVADKELYKLLLAP